MFGARLQRPRVVLSGLPSDSHSWNLVLLESILTEQGYDVVNLGVCVPTPELVEQTRRHLPCGVVISSVNGNGHRDGVIAAEALRRDADLHGHRFWMVIGGKLGIDGNVDRSSLTRLAQAGFDAVFCDADRVDPIADFLEYLRSASPAGLVA